MECGSRALKLQHRGSKTIMHLFEGQSKKMEWNSLPHNDSLPSSEATQLHPKRSNRAPRIGQLPRRSAIDEDDCAHPSPGPSAVQSAVNSGPSKRAEKLASVPKSTSTPDPLIALEVTGHRLVGHDYAGEVAEALPKSSSAIMASPVLRHPANRDQSEGSLNGPTRVNPEAEPTKERMIHFARVIESTKDLSLSDERQRSPTKPSPPATLSGFTSPPPLGPDSLVKVCPSQVPVPAKCSSQLRRLIHSHSISQPPVRNPVPPPPNAATRVSEEKATVATRPIFPQLPYSPYASPNSSPRIKRKPLRETNRVNSITESTGEFIQLNQYKLHESIGQGSYGIVKLAYNKEDNSHYAMKILSKKKLKRKGGFFGRPAPKRQVAGGGLKKGAEDPLQKVYREIAIMKKLDHPNVVKLVEVLDDPEDEHLYMVFEFLKGGEVLEIPTDSPLDEKAAWMAFRHVISGLEYLHYQKIIHRDIKPSNLLRTKDGLVKIADLGVSNEFNAQDDAFLTNSAGTPAFTPPESLSHKPGDDPYSGRSADIWSLGVTLYCLVIGQVPFHDPNILSLYNKIRTQPFSYPERFDISPELKDLLVRMLRKDPNDRLLLPEIKIHEWVTGFGLYPLPTEEENCQLVEITDVDVDNCVRTVPKLDTLILVKSMIKNHSFGNPFNTLRTRLGVNGRSNSAPEVTFFDDSDDE